jgi:hypothetical protein
MLYLLKKGLGLKERKRNRNVRNENKNARDKKNLGPRELNGKGRSVRELRLSTVNKSRNLI